MMTRIHRDIDSNIPPDWWKTAWFSLSERMRNKGGVLIKKEGDLDFKQDVFDLRTPSLLEKWAEDDLNSNVEYRTEDVLPMYEMIRFYEMRKEGGFMQDD